MRNLRSIDAVKWSVTQLSKRFDFSKVFVQGVISGLAADKAQGVVSGSAVDKAKLQKMVTEVVKSRWGNVRRIAREDRALRRHKWQQDA